MNITVNSGRLNNNFFIRADQRKILLLGAGETSNKAREILMPFNSDEVKALYGEGDLYEAYTLLEKLDVSNIYVSNCYSRSDYIRIVDKIMHYDFDFIVPLGIYFGDKFYNPMEDEEQFYVEFMLKQFSLNNSLTTIIMTEKHASLYEDFDHYTWSMNNKERDFLMKYDYSTSEFLEVYGNNLLFVYNNLKDVAFANVILAGLFYNRDNAKYLPSLSMAKAIYDIDNVDMNGLRAMYFKNNYYTKKVTIENTFNFKKTQDIYSNALVDDIIKRTIKSLDLDEYKGRLYNQYTALQIENSVNNSLKSLNGTLFKEYSINKIGVKKIEPNAVRIIIDFSIVPYGTLETINVIMGV